MKTKYGAISALIMAQMSMSVSATDADGTITVTGTVTPTSCTITAPNFNFGSRSFNDIVEATAAIQVQQPNAVSIQCSDDVKASSLVFTGNIHDGTLGSDLALTGSDGTVYSNGSIAYQPRIHTPSLASIAVLQEVLGLHAEVVCNGCSNPIPTGRNLISSTGTGAFGTTPVVIEMDHRLTARGRPNSGVHYMPQDTYHTIMNIALTY